MNRGGKAGEGVGVSECRVWIPTCRLTCSLAPGCETLRRKAGEARPLSADVVAAAVRGYTEEPAKGGDAA